MRLFILLFFLGRFFYGFLLSLLELTGRYRAQILEILARGKLPDGLSSNLHGLASLRIATIACRSFVCAERAETYQRYLVFLTYCT